MALQRGEHVVIALGYASARAVDAEMQALSVLSEPSWEERLVPAWYWACVKLGDLSSVLVNGEVSPSSLTTLTRGAKFRQRDALENHERCDHRLKGKWKACRAWA